MSARKVSLSQTGLTNDFSSPSVPLHSLSSPPSNLIPLFPLLSLRPVSPPDLSLGLPERCRFAEQQSGTTQLSAREASEYV